MSDLSPMMELFRSEVASYLEQARDMISRLVRDEMTDQDVAGFSQLCLSVQTAATLVGLSRIEAVAGRFADASGKMQAEDIKLNLVQPAREWIQLLERMTGEEPEVVVEERQAWLDQTESHLATLHQAESTAESAEQEKDQPNLDQDMMELFLVEMETHSETLSNGILVLEQQPDYGCEPLMRAAHSIKGAARIAGLDEIVQLAHAVEDFFSLLIKGQASFAASDADLLFQAVDVFQSLLPKAKKSFSPEQKEELARAIRKLTEQRGTAVPTTSTGKKEKQISADKKEELESIVRVTSRKLDRLLSFAGQAMVEAREGEGIANLILKTKTDFFRIGNHFTRLERRKLLPPEDRTDIHDSMNSFGESINQLIAVFDQHNNTLNTHTERLYNELVDIRMRPFEEGLAGYARMVREVARTLGKKVTLRVVGKRTEVDRDILQMLEAPLTHLLRNAVDHGIEVPEKRKVKGKEPTGLITLSAIHQGGMLKISVSDDGDGIDIEKIKDRAIERGLVTADLMQGLSESEILDFLFLPGFSTREVVSETSGRGFGMDVVQTMVRGVGGEIHIESSPGEGTSFTMTLPLTLSVVRVLLCEIMGSIFAFPLTRIERVLELEPSEITGESCDFYEFGGEKIRLMTGAKVLFGDNIHCDSQRYIIVIRIMGEPVGLTLDRLIIERDIVVSPMDKRLGKVQNIAATSMTRHGEVVLVIDMDDLTLAMKAMLSSASGHIRDAEKVSREQAHKILVVDDSPTVREMEKKVLVESGFTVETAADGMEGWNKFRAGSYDLLISDVDMPRMNGFELVERVKRDPKRSAIPVIMLSYKDRDEDRVRGMGAGADRYMNKGDFQGEDFIRVVRELLETI